MTLARPGYAYGQRSWENALVIFATGLSSCWPEREHLPLRVGWLQFWFHNDDFGLPWNIGKISLRFELANAETLDLESEDAKCTVLIFIFSVMTPCAILGEVAIIISTLFHDD